MEVVACMLIDKYGKIKYTPQSFKPNDCDICISNYKIGKIGNNTLFYVLLDYEEEYGNDTCWTVSEVMRRAENKKIKIFTRIQDFYNHITELQFAYIDSLEDYDETLDMDVLKEFCNSMSKTYLGEKNGIKFFRYKKIGGN